MNASTEVSHPAQELIGRTLLSYEMPIEQGKVREFARATGSTDPAYNGADAVVPLTFLTASAFWEPTDGLSLVERLGVHLPRVLHGAQEYAFPGDLPRVGDLLAVDVTVESVTTKDGKRGGSMTFIVVLTTFRRGGHAGPVVAEGRSTVIERSQ